MFKRDTGHFVLHVHVCVSVSLVASRIADFRQQELSVCLNQLIVFSMIFGFHYQELFYDE